MSALAVSTLGLLVALVGFHAPEPMDLTVAAPPTFDVGRALALAERIAGTPDRTPGSPTAEVAAATVVEAFRALGLEPVIDRFTAVGRDGHRTPMTNITVLMPGASSEAIVIFAHRDNVPPGADLAGTALGTASVVELAAAFLDVEHGRSLIVSSVDGGTAGDAGARRLAVTLPAGSRAVAAIAVQGIAGSGPIVIADRSDSRARTSAAFVEAVRRRLAGGEDAPVGEPGFFREFAAMVVPPRAPGGQAPFLQRGVPALTIGDDTRAPSDVAPDAARLTASGQAINDLVGSLDAGAEPGGTASYVRAGNRLVSGFLIVLLAASLLVPPTVVAIGLVARTARARLSLRASLQSILRLALVPIGAAIGAAAGGVLGLVPTAAYEYPFPGSPGGGGTAAVTVMAAGALVGLLAVRFIPRSASSADPAERAVVVLTAALAAGCCGAGLALVMQPAVGVLLVPALHAWILVPRAARWAAVALALVPLCAPALAIVWAAGTGPAELARLIADGGLPIGAAIGGAICLGAAVLLAQTFAGRAVGGRPAR